MCLYSESYMLVTIVCNQNVSNDGEEFQVHEKKKSNDYGN